MEIADRVSVDEFLVEENDNGPMVFTVSPVRSKKRTQSVMPPKLSEPRSTIAIYHLFGSQWPAVSSSVCLRLAGVPSPDLSSPSALNGDHFVQIFIIYICA